MMVATFTTDETRVIRGQAQAVLAEEAEAETATRNREDAQRQEVERRNAALQRAFKLTDERIVTAGKAQEAAENLAKELTLLHQITADERVAYREAGMANKVRLLDVAPANTRISGYLDGVLHLVTGKWLQRYGVIMLTPTSKVTSSWAEAERKVLPPMTFGESK